MYVCRPIMTHFSIWSLIACRFSGHLPDRGLDAGQSCWWKVQLENMPADLQSKRNLVKFLTLSKHVPNLLLFELLKSLKFYHFWIIQDKYFISTEVCECENVKTIQKWQSSWKQWKPKKLIFRKSSVIWGEINLLVLGPFLWVGVLWFGIPQLVRGSYLVHSWFRLEQGFILG